MSVVLESFLCSVPEVSGFIQTRDTFVSTAVETLPGQLLHLPVCVCVWLISGVSAVFQNIRLEGEFLMEAFYSLNHSQRQRRCSCFASFAAVVCS